MSYYDVYYSLVDRRNNKEGFDYICHGNDKALIEMLRTTLIVSGRFGRDDLAIIEEERIDRTEGRHVICPICYKDMV